MRWRRAITKWGGGKREKRVVSVLKTGPNQSFPSYEPDKVSNTMLDFAPPAPPRPA
jgi:hypothetical protein